MLFRVLSSLLLLPLLGAATLSECDETDPVEEDHFPEGSYYFQSAYAFTFDDAPYVLTLAGNITGNDASLGDMTGEFYWLFWNDRSSYDANSSDPDCLFIDTLTGVEHPEGSVPGTSYLTCPGCDPFSTVTLSPDNNQGCSQELYDYWYLDPVTGEPLEDFVEVTGYRHAETDGWPDEFSGIAGDLEASGYEGTLYDELVQFGLLAPNYFVGPAESGQRLDPLHLPMAPVLSVVPSQVRYHRNK